MERSILSILIFIERETMKAQLKFKDKVYENYLIDENGIIYDLEGNVQQKKSRSDGRYYFKGKAVYRLVMHSHKEYLKGFQIHHLNEDKSDDRLENLVYLTISEHKSIHNIGNKYGLGKKHSEEWKQHMREINLGKLSPTCGFVWVNNGVKNKFVKPDDIPEGYIKGRIGKKLSQETRIKMSQSRRGNTNVRGRVWVNNGVINKSVYPNEIPDGFVRGKLQKNCK